MKEEHGVNKQKRTILNSLLIITVLFIAIIIALIVQKIYAYRSAQENYASVKAEVITEGASAFDRKIDFSILDTKNSGVCSWIYIPDTMIDYPVVQGIDNDIYLSYDAYGNESESGAIFMNYVNSPDLSDSKTIIYGHSMKDGSMFHALHDYTDEGFAMEHNHLYLYTDTSDVIDYQLLCTLKANCYDETIYTYSAYEDPDATLDYLLDNADHIYGESTDENIIILSTCIKGDSRRVVVFQKTV